VLHHSVTRFVSLFSFFLQTRPLLRFSRQSIRQGCPLDINYFGRLVFFLDPIVPLKTPFLSTFSSRLFFSFFFFFLFFFRFRPQFPVFYTLSPIILFLSCSPLPLFFSRHVLLVYSRRPRVWRVFRTLVLAYSSPFLY